MTNSNNQQTPMSMIDRIHYTCKTQQDNLFRTISFKPLFSNLIHNKPFMDLFLFTIHWNLHSTKYNFCVSTIDCKTLLSIEMRLDIYINSFILLIIIHWQLQLHPNQHLNSCQYSNRISFILGNWTVFQYPK